MSNTFKQDLQKKLFQLGVIPLILLSILLITKIYFTLNDLSTTNHTQILKSIDYKLNSFVNDIHHKANFFKQNINKVHLKEFLQFNKGLESIIILDNKGIVVNSVSQIENNFFNGFDYSNKDIYKKYKQLKHPLFSDIEFSIATNNFIVSYIFNIKDNVVVFNINLNSIASYIRYFKNDKNIQIIIADHTGKYIVNTDSDLKNLNDSLFATDIYKKGVKKTKPYSYTEIYDSELNINHHIMYTINQKTKWFVITMEHEDTVDINITKIIIWVILFIIIIMAIMLFGINKLASRILHPLDILIANMEKFASMKITKEIPLESNYPMFQKLEQSFNSLQQKILQRDQELQNLNNSLEDKVEIQTKKLKELNNSLSIRVEEEVKANKQKEQILFEQSKMAAMGEMIGNIAHQWRQPLSVISTLASTAQMKHEMGIFDDKEFIKSMDKIVDSTNFLSNTIDDFRNFFKKDKQKISFTMQELLDINLKLLEASFKNSGIIIEQQINNISILGYKNEMVQAMLNILNNAKDVLKEQSLETKIILISNHIENNTLKITIQDNGGGIKKEVIHRIFEPYFTTKHKSQGTGIGLYMTREIIVQHMNGDISVSNEEFIYNNQKYTGAKFTITLPL